MEINISWSTLWRVTAIILLLLFCWYFRQIIFIFLGALVLATSLEGIINYFEKFVRKRIIAVVLVYITLFACIFGIIYIITPLLIDNIADLINDFPALLETPWIQNWINKYSGLRDLLLNNSIQPFNINNAWASVHTLLSGIGNIISRFTNTFADILLILLLSFYISIQKNWFKRTLSWLAPTNYKEYFINLWEKSENKMIIWLYSQILISLFVFSTTFVILYFLGFKYALLAGIIYGGLEFIPYLGPIFGAIIIIGLNINAGPIPLLILTIVLIAVQQIENAISPYIRGKFLNVNPLVIILAIALGEKLAGFLGILIAIPLSTIIVDIIKDISQHKFSFKQAN